MFKKLQELFNKRFDYSEQDRLMIESLHLEKNVLESISEMKATGGWKILESKLRDEVKKTILEKVKDDIKINLILQILSTVETKSASLLLEEEVKKVIPE